MNPPCKDNVPLELIVSNAVIAMFGLIETSLAVITKFYVVKFVELTLIFSAFIVPLINSIPFSD